jgi:HAD superfamily hydrolase (TIGR01509 family)
MKFQAVLFDCDGVLVDSEPITNGVLRDMLEDSGWRMTLAECMDFFVGKAVKDERATIEARTGRPLTEAWMQTFRERRNAGLQAGLTVVPGALEGVRAALAHAQGRIACASGADRFKVELQLAKVGLLAHFEGRIFSGHEMLRSKPAPDVYLAAAAHLAAAPAQCLVIEDTAPGARAGLDAGATVWGYCPQGHGRAFDGLPVARIFSHMGDLPALLASADI